MSEQYAFAAILEEMEAEEAARLSAHRTNVQAFFDELSEVQKHRLARWLDGSSDWLTFQALGAAAGDWALCKRQHALQQHEQGDRNGNVLG